MSAKLSDVQAIPNTSELNPIKKFSKNLFARAVDSSEVIDSEL